MNILLDNQAFIWFAEDDSQLDDTMKILIEKSSNDIFLSIVSIWEMAIKMQLKKLNLDKSIEDIIDIVTVNGIELLPILPYHIIKMTTLDFYHRDPFDRIIIAQGLFENLSIMSRDAIFDEYGVARMWK